MRRVVVTGLGPVSSIGIGNNDFWESARQGRGYFRNTEFPDVEIEQYKSRVCSPIDAFTLEGVFEYPRRLRRAGKATQYALLGTYLALEDAGLKVEFVGDKENGRPGFYSTDVADPKRCGVILGQSMDNPDVHVAEHVKFIHDRGPKRVNPFTLPYSNINVSASLISEWFAFKGTNFTIATACASATHAIGMATMNIMNGLEDLVVTGGTDAPIDPYYFSGFDVIKALSCRNADPMGSSRPWDRDRDGFVVGEGAGILIFEELVHAQRRGARIYGEIIGFGYTADAYNIVAPDPYGKSAIEAINRSLSMAKISPREIEYINAHGTSTVLNDPNESYIVKNVFGDYAYKIPISSSKSLFGHTLGAAGGLESIVTLLSMHHGTITPTANLEHPDLEYEDQGAPQLDKRCDLDYVPNTGRKIHARIAMKTSFGFGGQNGALIFKKHDK